MTDYIGFPSLNIEMHLPSVAFSIGNKEIYWYGIIIAIAMVIGYILAANTAKKNNISTDYITDIVLYGTPMAIICARIYYVLFSLDYYLQYPSKIFAIWEGGIAIYGAVIGAVLTAFIYCNIKKISWRKIFDVLIPSVILGQAIGRWGNFFNKEAFGTATGSFFRMAIYQNSELIEVHPTFLYESIWNFAVFSILLYINNHKRFEGQTFFLYLILYGIGRFFIEGLRTDSLYFYSFRVSQIVAVVTIIVGIAAYLYFSKQKKSYSN